MRLVVLSGGVGGARMADGFARILPPESLAVVVNTGDDFESDRPNGAAHPYCRSLPHGWPHSEGRGGSGNWAFDSSGPPPSESGPDYTTEHYSGG
jgi:hypothetical protein